jgi:hypothetical protein
VLYPHENQVALMFDRQLSSYEKIAGDCARLLAATYGQPFNRSEHN